MNYFLKTAFLFSAVLILIILPSCSHRVTYNPYIKMKERPSELQLKEDKKVIKDGNKAYAKQIEKNIKTIATTKSLSRKKQYSHLTKRKKIKRSGWRF